jgi:hypothetical protein
MTLAETKAAALDVFDPETRLRGDVALFVLGLGLASGDFSRHGFESVAEGGFPIAEVLGCRRALERFAGDVVRWIVVEQTVVPPLVASTRASTG